MATNLDFTLWEEKEGEGGGRIIGFYFHIEYS